MKQVLWFAVKFCYEVLHNISHCAAITLETCDYLFSLSILGPPVSVYWRAKRHQKETAPRNVRAVVVARRREQDSDGMKAGW